MKKYFWVSGCVLILLAVGYFVYQQYILKDPFAGCEPIRIGWECEDIGKKKECVDRKGN